MSAADTFPSRTQEVCTWPSGRAVGPPVSVLYSSTQNLHRSVDKNSRSLGSPCRMDVTQSHVHPEMSDDGEVGNQDIKDY